MANTEIRLIVFFAAKDGEVLYSQQKTDCGSDHELMIDHCGSDHELIIIIQT